MSEKIRILHVTDAWGGGVQTAIRAWSEVVPFHDHSVVAIARPGQSTGDSLIPVELLHGGIASLARVVRGRIARGEVDILHLHSTRAGTLRMFRYQVPVVYSPHCFGFERTDLGRLKRSLIMAAERFFATRTDVVAAVGAHEASLATQLNARGVVDIPNFSDQRGEALRSPAGRSVITIGRISPQKDPLFVAKVATRLRPGTTMTWIGDGDTQLKKALLEAGVIVTGWLDLPEMTARLRDADLYLHGAAWEASPFALIEAAATGVPVVTRTIPSLAEIGYYCAGATPERLASQADAFLDGDSELTAAVMRSTREVRGKLTPEAAKVALTSAYALAASRERR